MDYSAENIATLQREKERLEDRYDEISDECAKEGLSYKEFQKKSESVKEQIYLICKYIRLKQDPSLQYDKEWFGDLMTLEEFIAMCQHNMFVDDDGYGYYATENAKSDILLYPSDITEGIYRKDFSHVIWFNK